MEPTLSDIFPGALQDINEIIIPKTALAAAGLSVTETNAADRIVVAILILLKDFYTEARRTANPNASIVGVESTPNVDINFDSGINYLNRPIEFSLYSPLALPDLDPDSY